MFATLYLNTLSRGVATEFPTALLEEDGITILFEEDGVSALFEE